MLFALGYAHSNQLTKMKLKIECEAFGNIKHCFIDHDVLFLWYGWLTKGIKLYFQPGPLSDFHHHNLQVTKSKIITWFIVIWQMSYGFSWSLYVTFLPCYCYILSLNLDHSPAFTPNGINKEWGKSKHLILKQCFYSLCILVLKKKWTRQSW